MEGGVSRLPTRGRLLDAGLVFRSRKSTRLNKKALRGNVTSRGIDDALSLTSAGATHGPTHTACHIRRRSTIARPGLLPRHSLRAPSGEARTGGPRCGRRSRTTGRARLLRAAAHRTLARPLDTGRARGLDG